jgi:hypothetical protein
VSDTSVTKMSETKVFVKKVTGTKMFVIKMAAKMPDTKMSALKCLLLKFHF